MKAAISASVHLLLKPGDEGLADDTKEEVVLGLFYMHTSRACIDLPPPPPNLVFVEDKDTSCNDNSSVFVDSNKEESCNDKCQRPFASQTRVLRVSLRSICRYQRRSGRVYCICIRLKTPPPPPHTHTHTHMHTHTQTHTHTHIVRSVLMNTLPSLVYARPLGQLARECASMPVSFTVIPSSNVLY
jgi:hypothetical protein